MLIQIVDLMGVAVFAASGALVASRKEMDLIGFGLLGTLTGIGGGTLRDLVLDRPVFWVTDQIYLVVCLGMALLTFLCAPQIQTRYAPLLWADAIGLSVFAVSGARISQLAGAAPLTCVALGVMSACFGGLARDLTAQENPLLLKPELYATAALGAASVYVLLTGLGLAVLPSLGLGTLAGLLLRGGAILAGWSLPRYRPRPGREW